MSSIYVSVPPRANEITPGRKYRVDPREWGVVAVVGPAPTSDPQFQVGLKIVEYCPYRVDILNFNNQSIKNS